MTEIKMTIANILISILVIVRVICSVLIDELEYQKDLVKFHKAIFENHIRID